MKNQFASLIVMLMLLLIACSPNVDSKYSRQVGDITFNPELDTAGFQPCDKSTVYQYYNFSKGLQYNGEKSKIYDFIFSNYQPPKSNFLKNDGYITIRFIVNCKGESGYYRVEEMKHNFEPHSFDPEVVNGLLALTSRLNNWTIAKANGRPFDYYQYLTFKIQKGQLTEILP